MQCEKKNSSRCMSGELVNHYHWFGLEAFLGFFRPVQLFFDCHVEKDMVYFHLV